MNRFLDRLAEIYAPLGRRGLLMDGQYRFAEDPAPLPRGKRAPVAAKASPRTPSRPRSLPRKIRTAP